LLAERRGTMSGFLKAILKISEIMQLIASIALTFIILLTTADVIMRGFGRPILGTYEIVAMCGGVVIGFVTPITAWLRGHVYVDFVVKKFSPLVQDAINIITRCVGIAMFTMIGVNVMRIGNTFRRAGEISNTLQLPLYPIAYAVGLSFFVLAAALVCDISKIRGGSYE
jgi:TRAP-type C4-dicarboxylate transport system permease small subunit